MCCIIVQTEIVFAPMIKIAVVDDHNLFRRSLINLIGYFENCEVVLEADSGIGFTKKMGNTAIDVIILDLMMPGMDGIETCEEIIQEYPESKVLILSMADERATVARTAYVGASGYITKNCTDTELFSTISRIANGGNVFSFQLETIFDKNLILAEFEQDQCDNFIALSKREKLILELICDQKNNYEIAAEIDLSVRTVESYRQKLIEKTESKNIIGVVLYAEKYNLFG